MKIIINGSNGRVGREIKSLLVEGYRNSKLAGAVDRNNTNDVESRLFKELDDVQGEADCIIDFTNHLATKDLTQYALRKKLPLVIGTTGQTKEELEIIREASREIPVFLAANMSLGIALLVEVAKTVTRMMPDADIEIVEKHHNRKLDSPSGTALLIGDEIRSVRQEARYVFGRSGMAKREKDEIGIHALRFGDVIGEHEVIIGTDAETISLKHEAHSRSLFAEGAMLAAEFLIDQGPGFYGMADLIV